MRAPGAWVLGLLMAIFAIYGLFMAKHAQSDFDSILGMIIAAAGVLAVFGSIHWAFTNGKSATDLTEEQKATQRDQAVAWIVGILAVGLAILGLFMGALGKDIMFRFVGVLFFIFGVFNIFNLINRHIGNSTKRFTPMVDNS